MYIAVPAICSIQYRTKATTVMLLIYLTTLCQLDRLHDVQRHDNYERRMGKKVEASSTDLFQRVTRRVAGPNDFLTRAEHRDSQTATADTPLSRNRKVHCRVNKSPPPDHILSHLGPLHTQHSSGFSGRATKLQALCQGCTNPGRHITMATTVHCRVNKSLPTDHILSHLGPLHTQHPSGFSGRATKLQALYQGCTNPGRHMTMATTLCTAAPNICVSPVRNLISVNLLAARILMWFLEFGKYCAPLSYVAFRNMIVLAIRNCDQNSLWIIAEEEKEFAHVAVRQEKARKHISQSNPIFTPHIIYKWHFSKSHWILIKFYVPMIGERDLSYLTLRWLMLYIYNS